MQDQTWSIIIFAYNEEGSILGIMSKAYDILHYLSPKCGELIIVDDGSTDETRNHINTFSDGKSDVFTIFHKTNEGIGSALISGYKAAKGDNICAIPADGQFDPKELIPYKEIEEQTIISFYRKKKHHYSTFRKILTFFNRYLNRYLLGIKMNDVNWVKVYKKKSLIKTGFYVKSSLVESEICAKMLLSNKRLIEVASEYKRRESGKSKGASFKIVVKALSDLFTLYSEIKRYKRSLQKEN